MTNGGAGNSQTAGGVPPRKLAAGGVATSWVRLVVNAALGFVQIPILFRYVPQAELGVWYLLFALATFIYLSDLGLPSTFSRAVAFLWGAGADGRAPSSTLPALYRGARLGDLYASALVGTAFLSVAFAAVTLPAASLYLNRSFPSGANPESWLPPLVLFLAGAVANLVAAIPLVCLTGHGDVSWDNLLRTAANVVGFVLICVLVPHYKSLEVLCAIYLVQGLLLLGSGHGVLAWRHPGVRVRGPLNMGLVRGMYTESVPVFVSRLGMWFTQESTLLIAGYFLGPARIADFGVLRQLLAIAMAVTTAIPLAVSPHASAAHAAGDEDKFRSLYLAAARYSLVLAVLWTVGFLLWAPEVLQVLIGPEHFLGYAVLVPLVLAMLLEAHGATHGFFVFATGQWPFTRYVIAGGILNVALASTGSVLFGFAGLAWGSMVSQAATTHWAPVLFGLKQIGVGLRSYLDKTIVPTVVFAVALAASGGLLKWGYAALSHPAQSGAGAGAYLAAGIIATASLAGVLAWRLTLSAGDRAYFLQLARPRGADPSSRFGRNT